jgi:hypothetical protein
MLLARPKVFGEINDPTLNILFNGDDGGNMHHQNSSLPTQLHRVRTNTLQFEKKSSV